MDLCTPLAHIRCAVPAMPYRDGGPKALRPEVHGPAYAATGPPGSSSRRVAVIGPQQTAQRHRVGRDGRGVAWLALLTFSEVVGDDRQAAGNAGEDDHLL